MVCFRSSPSEPISYICAFAPFVRYTLHYLSGTLLHLEDSKVYLEMKRKPGEAALGKGHSEKQNR